MTNNEHANELPPLGITFYCPSHEDFRKVFEIRAKLIDALTEDCYGSGYDITIIAVNERQD